MWCAGLHQLLALVVVDRQRGIGQIQFQLREMVADVLNRLAEIAPGQDHIGATVFDLFKPLANRIPNRLGFGLALDS